MVRAVRDVWTYLWGLANHKVIVAVGLFVPFILAFVSIFHPIALSPLGWLTVAGWALVLAGFLLWRGNQLMSPKHLAYVQGLAREAAASIRAHSETVESGPSLAHSNAFRKHFRHLMLPVARFDMLPDRIREAMSAAEDAIAASAKTRMRDLPSAEVYGRQYVVAQMFGGPVPCAHLAEGNTAVLWGTPDAGDWGAIWSAMWFVQVPPDPEGAARNLLQRFDGWLASLLELEEVELWGKLEHERITVAMSLETELETIANKDNLRRRDYHCDDDC